MIATRKYKFKLRKKFRQRTSRRNRRTNRNNNANRRTRNRTNKGGMLSFGSFFGRKSPSPPPSQSPTPSSASERSTPSVSPTPSSESERSTPSPSPPRASGVDAVNANFEEANREVTEIVPEINEQLDAADAALETAISKMSPEMLKSYKDSIVFIKDHFNTKIETMQQAITERRDAIRRRHKEQLAKFEEENSKLMEVFRAEHDPKQRLKIKGQSEQKIKEMNQFSGKIDADANDFKRQNRSAVLALKRDMHNIIHQLERNIGKKGSPQSDPLHGIILKK